MTEKIKNTIAGYFIRQAEKNNARNKGTVIFAEAVNVAVVFPLEYDTISVIQAFVENLEKQGKKVFALGFTTDKSEVKEIPFCTILTRKDLKWYKLPRKESIASFSQEKFDILIDLSLEDHMTLLYLDAVSDARMRVSLFSDQKKQLCDMMIHHEAGKGLIDLIEQIIHYLKIIKN